MLRSLYNKLIPPKPVSSQRFLSESDKEALAFIDSDTVSYMGPMIQISGVCNLKCTMCGGAQDLVPGKFMELSLFETICQKLIADDIHGMIIAGAYGEPFLHPKIFEILECAKKYDFRIVLSTHGNNLDEEKIKRLVTLNLSHIQVSYCGYDAETYERIYKGGKFAKATETIRLLKHYLRDYPQTEFLINGVCDQDGPNMAARTRELLMGLGVGADEMRIIMPHNYGGQAAFDDMESFGDTKSFKELRGEHLSICKVLVKASGILWDGRISACGCLDYKGTLDIGNIKFMSLKEARQSPRFREIVEAFRLGDVSKIPLCDSCDVPYGESDAVVV